jgi:hypothetical protein
VVYFIQFNFCFLRHISNLTSWISLSVHKCGRPLSLHCLWGETASVRSWHGSGFLGDEQLGHQTRKSSPLKSKEFLSTKQVVKPRYLYGCQLCQIMCSLTTELGQTMQFICACLNSKLQFLRYQETAICSVL